MYKWYKTYTNTNSDWLHRTYYTYVPQLYFSLYVKDDVSSDDGAVLESLVITGINLRLRTHFSGTFY